MSEIDAEGFVVDEYGQQWGECNACGDEVPLESDCCEDGEVVPVEDGEQ